MEETADNEKLKYEIVESKNILEEKIGNEVISFCWVGGEEHTYTKKAFQLIQASSGEVPSTAARHRFPLDRCLRSISSAGARAGGTKAGPAEALQAQL